VDRRTRYLFLLLFVAIVGVTAGAAILSSGAGTREGPPGTTAVTGVIVGVDSRGLGDVRAFTLRVVGGETIEFDLRALENGVEFPPGHLAEHQATADPVKVWYREDDGARMAIRVDDAPR
jgi:hypothetical protein